MPLVVLVWFISTDPQLGEDATKQEFKLFLKKWKKYVRSSGETDEVLLRDQLLNCPDETLQRALYLALDNRVDTIYVVKLMKEIKALAMVTKSNIVELPKTPIHTD